jgi:hypothetical protein
VIQEGVSVPGEVTVWVTLKKRLLERVPNSEWLPRETEEERERETDRQTERERAVLIYK